MSSQVEELRINSFEDRETITIEDVAGMNHDDQSDVIAKLLSTVEEPNAEEANASPALGDSEETAQTLQLFSDAEDVSVPLVMQSLVASSGACFIHVTQSTWSKDVRQTSHG